MEEKKFRLLKDLPNCKAGMILTKQEWYDQHFVDNIVVPSVWFEEVKEEFKVGDWVVFLVDKAKELGLYTSTWNKPHVLRIHSIPNNSYNKHGASLDFAHDEYSPFIMGASNSSACFRLATKEEIETHLIAEAKKRGYKDGVQVKSFVHNKVMPIYNSARAEYIGLDGYNDKLHFGMGGKDSILWAVIYCDGKWAEIVEDKPKKIGEYTVTVDKCNVSIGCQYITRERYDAFLNILNQLKIDYVNSDTYGIRDLDTRILFDIIGQRRAF